MLGNKDEIEEDPTHTGAIGPRKRYLFPNIPHNGINVFDNDCLIKPTAWDRSNLKDGTLYLRLRHLHGTHVTVPTDTLTDVRSIVSPHEH